MAETRLSDEALGRLLAAAGRELELPGAPALGASVTARLEADAASRRRPVFPRLAIWGPRRTLVAVAVGLLALLGLAFGARWVLGAAEVRVQPGVTPSGPPLGPGSLGEPLPLEVVSDAVGFDVALPDGPAPDATYLVRTDAGPAALLAWNSDEPSRALPETPWGLVLLQITADEEIIVKSVDRYEDLSEVEVGGRPAFWIDAPHQLLVATSAGDEAFAVEGNVLIWTEGDVTYRMETTLRLRAAIALAESVG